MITSRGLENGQDNNRLNVILGGPDAVRVTVTQKELFGTTGFIGAHSFDYGDFDGSCRPDAAGPCDDELLVGAFRSTVGGVADAGSMVYMKFDGTERRLDRSNLGGAPGELGLGRTIGVGDFNGDGFDDAAVSAFTLGDAAVAWSSCRVGQAA